MTTAGDKRRAGQVVQEVVLLEKQAQALELRKQGKTYEDIAKALGYHDASGASKAVKSALDRIIREPAKDVLQLELQRLDALLETALHTVYSGGGDEKRDLSLDAIDRVLRIMERRAKYLGLDKPTKVDTRIGDLARLSEKELREKYKQLAGREWDGT